MMVRSASSHDVPGVRRATTPSQPAPPPPAKAMPRSASPAIRPEAKSVAGSSSRAGPRRHSAIRPPKIDDAVVLIAR
jgi:hypothetical protein